jgi:hypothetical protein
MGTCVRGGTCYLARSALGWRRCSFGISGERRPKNLRKGYFTRKSGIPSLVVKALERTLFIGPGLLSLLSGFGVVRREKRMSEHVTRNVAVEFGQYLGEAESSGGNRPLGFGCNSPPTVRIHSRSKTLKATKWFGLRVERLACTKRRTSER